MLSIGDFSEDGGAMGAGGGGEIGRAMVESFVGEESEGVGFFRLFGNVEVGGRTYIDGIVRKIAGGPPPLKLRRAGEWRVARGNE